MSRGTLSRRGRRLVARLRDRERAPWPPRLPESWSVLRAGERPAPLRDGAPDPASAWSVAFVLPPFRRGSGGHQTVVALAHGLRERGHEVTLWIDDDGRAEAGEERAQAAERFRSWFGTAGLTVHAGLAAWRPADVVVATGWQTVWRVLRLPGCAARAYVAQDHEPEFFPTSMESRVAADSYRQGLHCVAASPWLAGLLRDRYGATTSHFDLAVDHSVYRPGPSARRPELVAFYARAETPRRALPLALVALEELCRRRPGVRVAVFGGAGTLPLRFSHEHHATLPGPALAEIYRRATVGLSLSLTNPSLIPLEMMACGLPCVELDVDPVAATFGADGPLALAAPDPLALCETIERLLDDPTERDLRRERGLALMGERRWERAAVQLEQGLRCALAPQSRG